MSVNVGYLKLYPTTRPHEGTEIITLQVLQIQQQEKKKFQWRLLSTERPPSLSFKLVAAKSLFWRAVYLVNSSVLLNPIHLVAYKNLQSLICSLAAQLAPPHCTLLSLLFSFWLGYLAHICSEFNLINYSPAPSYINISYQRQSNELLLSIGQLFPCHTFDISF